MHRCLHWRSQKYSQIIALVSTRSIMSSFGWPSFCRTCAKTLSIHLAPCGDLVKLWGIKLWPMVLFFDLATGFSVLEVGTESVCHTWELEACPHSIHRVMFPRTWWIQESKVEQFALRFTGLWDELELGTLEDRLSHGDQISRRSRFCNRALIFSSSFSFLDLPLRHGSVNLGDTKRWIVHHVEQTEKMIPFITNETPFRQNVCGWVFGI